MTVRNILQIFQAEFKCIEHLFSIHELNLIEAEDTNDLFVYSAGVYVFHKNKQVIKVGRSLENSRKRALEHIRDETQVSDFNMKVLKRDADATLVLFNLIDKSKYHWAAALEMYFENTLNPKIKSKRMG
jgi:hypothetical protein